MARVKVCEVCGFSNDASELFCHPCGSSLALVPETDSKNSTPIPESPRLQAVPVELTEDPPICAEIAFPWGLVPISGRLAVGRNEAFSPIAKKLLEWGQTHSAPVDAVSGVHAEIFVEAGSLYVRHLGGTNPTYVDDKVLSRGEVSQLSDGSVVAFSRALIATARIS